MRSHCISYWESELRALLLPEQPRRRQPRDAVGSDWPPTAYDCLLHPAFEHARLPVITVGGRYSGALRTQIIEWKELGRRHAAVCLIEILAKGVDVLLQDQQLLGARCLIVPVPGNTRSTLVRAGDVMWDLARAAAAESASRPTPARLLRRRHGRDQVGLTAFERRTNAAASYRSTRRPASLAPVILVDDVATTGATLVACAMALRARGWQVPGAVVLCATKVRARTGSRA